jgi:predicted amidohydrolase
MAPLIKKYKAAAVNAEPGWLDLELSVQKTIHWINDAGKNGCKLIAFPELCMYHTSSLDMLFTTYLSYNAPDN